MDDRYTNNYITLYFTLEQTKQESYENGEENALIGKRTKEEDDTGEESWYYKSITYIICL